MTGPSRSGQPGLRRLRPHRRRHCRARIYGDVARRVEANRVMLERDRRREELGIRVDSRSQVSTGQLRRAFVKTRQGPRDRSSDVDGDDHSEDDRSAEQDEQASSACLTRARLELPSIPRSRSTTRCQAAAAARRRTRSGGGTVADFMHRDHQRAAHACTVTALVSLAARARLGRIAEWLARLRIDTS